MPGNLHLGDVAADGSVLLWDENSRIGMTGRMRGDTKDRDLSWLDWSLVPVISDDGTWVLTVRLNPAPAQLVLLPTGAGEAKQVTNDALVHDFGWFTTDGAHVVFAGFAPDHQPRLYLQALSGGTPKPITPEGVTGIPSPDGTLAAFGGKIYAADGGAPRPIPGIEPDDRIVGWASQSRGLFVVHELASGDYQMFLLDAAGRRTLAHQLEHAPGSTVGGFLLFAITPDGSAYVWT